MLNDLGKNYTVEECQKVTVNELELADALFIELGNQQIQLTSTKCNYGGSRIWFICPNCQNRIGALYCKPSSDEFVCRNCNNLKYQLQMCHRSADEYFLKAIHNMKLKN